jgi:hypothetical protein
MNDATTVQRAPAPASPSAAPVSSPSGGSEAVKGSLRGASFEEGASVLAPREPGAPKAGQPVQRMERPVQREEDPAKLAESILAAVQTDYKTSPIRMAYEADVAALKGEADKLLEGKDKTNDASLEDVARAMNQKRLDVGKKYKDLTILPLRDFILYANTQRYDTAYGPSYEFLRNSKGKTNMEVIEGSYRPNPDINSFLAPFGAWLKSQSLPDLKRYQAAVGGG